MYQKHVYADNKRSKIDTFWPIYHESESSVEMEKA